MNDFDELFFKRSVLGAKLEEKLSELGYTKTHFSKACGISRPTLDKILTGNISSKTNYEKHLAKVFGCLSITPEELLGNVKEPYSRTREIRTILSVKEDEIALSTSLSVDRLHAIEAGDSASLAEKLAAHTVTVVMPAGPNGKLYGAVSNQTVADVLNKDGFDIERKKITIPGLVIKTTGKFVATVHLYETQTAELSIVVKSQEQAEKEAAEAASAEAKAE